MKKISLLAAGWLSAGLLMAQSIDNEKYDVKYTKHAFVGLVKDKPSYASNNTSLRFAYDGISTTPDYKLEGKGYPVVAHANLWGEKVGTVAMSEVSNEIISAPYTISIKDKDNQMVYYRVFNRFEVVSPDAKAAKLGKDDNVPSFTQASFHISDLFTTRESSMDVKLFFVKKGDNLQDVNDAYNLCLKGIELNNAGDTAAGKDLMKQAVAKWETILSEANYDDNKARVNKKVADAVLKNLFQIEMLIGNSKKANEYCEMDIDKVQGFTVMFSMGKRQLIKAMGQNDLAKAGGGKLTIDEFEFPELPAKYSGSNICPQNTEDAKNLIFGSWRLSSANRETPRKDQTVQLIHLSPSGDEFIQTGSWEVAGSKPNMDARFWKVIKATNGQLALVSAFSKDDLNDINGNLSTLDIFPIEHLTKDKLIIKSSSINDGDTTRSGLLEFDRVFSNN